ncbi:MAG TPA: hypothetical protein VHH36_05780 [Candidatus Thermoplasmatota archaeon]|nr:hypothetical protein [Candidatus Thermoplasmatota archaeon]
MRLCCPRCGAGLVPSWSGLRCPRMTACGRGGFVESGRQLHPLAATTLRDDGVRA